jgi:hypothetical protein
MKRDRQRIARGKLDTRLLMVFEYSRTGLNGWGSCLV